MISTRESQLSRLLQFAADELDIPESLDRELTSEYERLGRWLEEDNAERFRTDSELYTQGSRRLGTLIRPVRSDDDYDIDVVYVRHLSRSGTTQGDLKEQAGEQLARYAAVRRREGAEVVRREKQRCWQLQFGDRYHMDVLPALPDEESAANNVQFADHGIVITDKDLVRWQPSNPRGYALWFEGRAAQFQPRLKAEMDRAAGVEVEEVPVRTMRTPLHLAVQLLKRHRDLRYQGNPDDKPISIIITTLAAESYDGEQDLLATLRGLPDQMRSGIEQRGGTWWVPNPVATQENFADKWRIHPERADRFFEWLEQVEYDLDRALRADGIHRTTDILGESFGDAESKAAARRFGESMRQTREAGKLKVSERSATLGTAAGLTVAPHTFYGDLH